MRQSTASALGCLGLVVSKDIKVIQIVCTSDTTFIHKHISNVTFF